MRINSIMSTYSLKENSAAPNRVAKNTTFQQQCDTVSFSGKDSYLKKARGLSSVMNHCKDPEQKEGLLKRIGWYMKRHKSLNTEIEHRNARQLTQDERSGKVESKLQGKAKKDPTLDEIRKANDEAEVRYKEEVMNEDELKKKKK